MGTPKHLVVGEDSEEFSWVDSPPDDAWIFGSDECTKSLDVLSKLYNIEIRSLFPEEHERAFSVLCESGSPGIPWHLAISPERFRRTLQNIIRDLQSVVEDHVSSPYGQTFIKERDFILGLSRAHVDKEKIRSCMASEENRTVRSFLRSFFPDKYSVAPKVDYSQVATHTGRLTVIGGPQILTLPSRHRGIIKSRFEEGEILQVDFVSVEPRLARLLVGETPGHDVYKEICASLFSSKIDRKTAKIAVLCALYGASTVRLQRILGDHFDARKVVRKLRDYFGVDALGVKLRSELSESGFIRNWFERKLFVERTSTNVLINNFVQSSAVDVTLLGFKELLNNIRGMHLETEGIFLIHDALLLDVPPREGSIIRDLAERGIEVDGLGNFPLKVDVIT